MNPLRRLLLGPGRLPEGLRASLRAEGIVILAEGVPGTVTFRHLRMPGQRANWKRVAVNASIALSTKRFVVNVRRFKHVDVPVTQLARYRITVTEPHPNRLAVAYDLATTHPDWRGTVELLLRTDQAARIVRSLPA